MEKKHLCENTIIEINNLFINDKKLNHDKVSERLKILFDNGEFNCIENIIKILPDNKFQGAVIQNLLDHIKYYHDEELIPFYKNSSYYRLKIYTTYVLGWKYLDSFDLDSAKEIQVETLHFIKEDCPILSDSYLYSVIYQYIQSKINNVSNNIDYDANIRYFIDMISNEKIIKDIGLLLMDYDSNYMHVFDCDYMILGFKIE